MWQSYGNRVDDDEDVVAGVVAGVVVGVVGGVFEHLCRFGVRLRVSS